MFVSNITVCPYCGKYIEKESHSCKFCGEALKSCPICGEANKVDSSLCIKCGKEIEPLKTEHIEEVKDSIQVVDQDNTKNDNILTKDQNHKEQEKKFMNLANNNKRVYLMGGSLLITLLVLVGLWLIHSNKPEVQFEKANELFHECKFNEAIKILSQLAEKENYTPAKIRLANLYLFNDSIPSDSVIDTGLKYLEEVAALDNSSLGTLVDIYMGNTKCKGKEKSDPEKAEYYAKLMIRKDYNTRSALFDLGCLYTGTADHSKDYEKAYKCWKEAAEKYNCSASYTNLGWMYRYGNGVATNYAKAKYYFEKALELDTKEDYALYHLGLIYKYGLGVPNNQTKAKEYLQKSVEANGQMSFYAQKELDSM